MNITGHKLKSKLALKKERFWKELIEEQGYSAQRKYNFWRDIKLWNNSQIRRLKRLNENKYLNT